MSCCIVKTPEKAAFFSHSWGDVVAEAAQYLLTQLPDRRLNYMVQESSEIVIYTRCTRLQDLVVNQGFFLQVSTYLSSGMEIEGGLPEEILELPTYEEKLKFVESLLLCAIESYDMYIEDEFVINPIHAENSKKSGAEAR